MRPHSKVAVQKLYGRIDVPLEAGQEVVISVANRYNSYAYNGAKAGERCVCRCGQQLCRVAPPCWLRH